MPPKVSPAAKKVDPYALTLTLGPVADSRYPIASSRLGSNSTTNPPRFAWVILTIAGPGRGGPSVEQSLVFASTEESGERPPSSLTQPTLNVYVSPHTNRSRSIEVACARRKSLLGFSWSGPAIEYARSLAAGPGASSQLKRMLPAFNAVPLSPPGADAVGWVQSDVVPRIEDCGPSDVPSLQLTASS